MPTISDIPQELRDRPQWVLWRKEERDGRTTKVPYAPGVYKAKSTDLATWSTLDAVLEAARTRQYDGIGFVFSSGDPYVGVDLDDCIADGGIEPWAQQVCEQLRSYTEVSPSGTGLHVIVKGKLPVGGCKTPMPDGGTLELYCRDRYLTFTGDVLDANHDAIMDRPEEIKALYREHFKRGRTNERASGHTTRPNGMADAELIEKAKAAKNGEQFSALWNGDTSDYGDDWSRADYALCSSLAFWAGGDAARMDALFRESGLMRPKWDEQRGAETYGERTVSAVLENQTDFYTPPKRHADTEGEEGKDERTQAQVLLDLADGCELFHTPKGEAFATYEVGGVWRTGAVGSSGFADFLRHGFYGERDKSPSAQALADAKDTLRAKARFDGETREVNLRVAGHRRCIYVDLCNDAWETAEITAGGWKVVSDPPVKFRRVQGMKPLPRPERGGTLNLLRRHVRLSAQGFTLLLGYLVQSVRPVGPYPMLELSGEQGSGKSTAAKMIRALVDPSHIPVRTRPRKERDLVIAAENSRVLAFDNMSEVKPWLSDALCRLSTGGGFGTRRLYADREEEIFYARRPLILNGINKLAGRSDLADRAIRLELEAIPDAERRTESDLWNDFERDRPRILGALFDAVSTALRREPDVQLSRLPRMADFARWAVAAEPAFGAGLNTNGSDQSAFLDAYETNRGAASEEAVEADSVSAAIRALLEEKGEWTGKTSELLEDLKGYLPDPKSVPRDYPDTHQAMTARLKRIMPDLRAVGIEREDEQRTSGSRTFRLYKTAPDPGAPSDEGQTDYPPATASPASPRHETAATPRNGRSAMTRRDAPPDTASFTASHQKPPSQAANGDNDTHDAHDAHNARQSKGIPADPAPTDRANVIPLHNGHSAGQQQQHDSEADDFDVVVWEQAQRRAITDGMNTDAK